MSGVVSRKRNSYGPYVSYNPATGDKFRDVKNGLIAATKRDGLTKVTWHMFRQSFASRVTRDGVDIVTVKDPPGHSSISTTLRYAYSK